MRSRSTCLTFLLMVVLSGCRENEEPLLAPLTSIEISGEVLWERIAQTFDYHSYSYWPGHKGVREGQAPHGPFHSIYINRTLRESLPDSDAIAEIGSIIVKDSLNASRELTSITVMVKVDGYDPDNGDWFWAKYSPVGTVQAEGSPKGCIACHAGMAHNDYIIVKRLDDKSVQE